MPDNLTRREFLKDLGLLGLAGGVLPAAAGLAPIRAIGEEWADKAGTSKRPAWVKEVAKPTIEIDWDVMERYAENHTVRRGLGLYTTEDEVQAWQDAGAARAERLLKEGRPGYTLRDLALDEGVGWSPPSVDGFIGPQEAPTPEDRGVPRWEGSPEENAMMVRAALRHLGAATVGFVKLEPDTTEKLIYSVDPDGKEMRIEDVDQPSEGEDYRVIPKKARYAIVWTVQMSQETLTRAPTPLGAMTTSLTYRRNSFIQPRLQEFLRGLGYMGIGESSTNALGIAPAFGTMAGLGEMSRLNRLITPEYGPMVRVFKMLTDLPVATTGPIDAGIMEFCRYCKTCAEYCPSGALSYDTDPTWETRGGWNNPGHKAYFEDSVKCREYWYSVATTNCGICFAVCPFAQKDKAAIHNLVQTTIAATPALDKSFVNASRLAYLTKPAGEPQKDPNEWWTLDIAEYGIDTTRGHDQA
jgi:epoxyqueuosine reductase